MLDDVNTTSAVAVSEEAEQNPAEIVRNFWQGGADLGSLEFNPKRRKTVWIV
jgi:hypothetical protein